MLAFCGAGPAAAESIRARQRRASWNEKPAAIARRGSRSATRGITGVSGTRMGADTVSSQPIVSKRDKLLEFMHDAGQLGTLRFIVISDGAVLETIGRLDYTKTPFDTPLGEYVTVASTDKLFECHVNCSKVSKVTLSTEPAKQGGHMLHVIRFKGADEQARPLLSCLLQYDPSQGAGNYLAGAVDNFNSLVQKYSNEMTF
ncbi:hypothetical protein FVE85_9451 [Porphyridium purpureum]|uniref:Uncharacterized protein n=1 Tax=Porphyridium purpureum TaxID=35688 RepID=A0A5J4YI60_PORPP|nr:hypothetical protein FVE85_9451 [Porphyridium purpureum]|eukprot:POR2783..scf261_15